jgi:hypothetical protein
MNSLPIIAIAILGNWGSTVLQLLERYHDFRSKSINVSKHVAVMGELSRLTDAY